jgi:hypothetical protein
MPLSAFAGSFEEASIMAISVKSISLWRRNFRTVREL